MKLKQSLVAAGIAAVMCLSGSAVLAQDGGGGGGGGGRRGGGNFDPAQFQQQRLERIRENMGVADDNEWREIQARLQKVFDAQLAVAGTRGGFGGRGGRGGGGGGGGRGGFGGTPMPELESLRNAIENDAPAEQVKNALAKYREARKTRESALAKAQTELTDVLTVKQEAVAVTQGLID